MGAPVDYGLVYRLLDFNSPNLCTRTEKRRTYERDLRTNHTFVSNLSCFFLFISICHSTFSFSFSYFNFCPVFGLAIIFPVSNFCYNTNLWRKAKIVFIVRSLPYAFSPVYGFFKPCPSSIYLDTSIFVHKINIHMITFPFTLNEVCRSTSGLCERNCNQKTQIKEKIRNMLKLGVVNAMYKKKEKNN